MPSHLSVSPVVKAFSLVEVVLAIGVVAFAVVGIVGLLPVGLTANRDSTQQTEAANIACLIESDIRSTPNTVNSDGSNYSSSEGSKIYGITFNGRDASETELFVDDLGNARNTQGNLTAQTGRFRATIRFGATAGRNAIPLSILITWPAQIDALLAPGRFEVATSLDRN